MRRFFRPAMMMGHGAQNRTIALLCLLIMGGTSDCTESSERPGGTPDSDAILRDQQGGDASEVGNIAPIRTIYDRYPTFAGVAIDPVNKIAVFTDDNTQSVLIYDSDTPGDSEHITDFRNNMLVFSYQQSGDAAPLRELEVDHGGWGMYLDHQNYNELFFTIQHLNKIAVYRPNAQGKEEPHRFIQGPKTGMSDPHGIFVDTVNDEIVVTNHHSSHQIETGVHAATLNFRHMLQSTGRFKLASITVYSRTAEGDTAPLRTIQGPKTGLNLPLGVVVDPERDVILVANDQTHSILAFSRTAQGDVAPLYAIEGPATELKNPGALQIDRENNELWVTNWGDHSVTIYARDARGNVAPLRTIRSASRGEPLAGLGRPAAIAWDSRRDELLVPN